jgi:hypothetical protein
MDDGSFGPPLAHIVNREESWTATTQIRLGLATLAVCAAMDTVINAMVPTHATTLISDRHYISGLLSWVSSCIFSEAMNYLFI